MWLRANPYHIQTLFGGIDMNKKDFWFLMLCNLVTVTLLVENLFGLCLSIECLCIWTIISLLVHISVLRDYIKVAVEVEED
jgi:uncharacterized membrane protein YhaH (DUF805 family)